MPGMRLPSRDALESLVVRGLGALPSRVQLLLGGPRPVRIDGQQLEPEVQLTLRLLKLSGRSAFEELPVAEARAEIRHEAAVYSGAQIPAGAGRGRRGPRSGRADGRTPLLRGGTPLPGAVAGLPARRRLGRRRPRHARPAVPLPRPARGRAGAVDRLPPRSRASVSRRRGGLGRRGPARDRPRRRASEPIPRGSRSAGTARRQPGCGRRAPAHDRRWPRARVPAADLSRHRPDAQARVLPVVQRGFLPDRAPDGLVPGPLPARRGGRRRSAGVTDSRREPVRVCRPHTSSRPGSTCSATRARTTPDCCAMPECRSRRPASPG